MLHFCDIQLVDYRIKKTSCRWRLTTTDKKLASHRDHINAIVKWSPFHLNSQVLHKCLLTLILHYTEHLWTKQSTKEARYYANFNRCTWQEHQLMIRQHLTWQCTSGASSVFRNGLWWKSSHSAGTVYTHAKGKSIKIWQFFNWTNCMSCHKASLR